MVYYPFQQPLNDIVSFHFLIIGYFRTCFPGSSDPYCEITVGSLTLKTPFVKRAINPKWNAPMQFLLYNLREDVIHINIFDKENYLCN
jgi:hypothetical protein